MLINFFKSYNHGFLLIFISIALAREPISPIEFNVTRVYYYILNYTVSLKWNLPVERSPSFTVDRYILSIKPKPVSQPTSNEIYSTIWNVTLNYNIEYTATITAVNCAGESNMVILPNIKYGKH